MLFGIKHKNVKIHPIPAFMKTYLNFKKIFLVGCFFSLKYISRIKFKIPILDLMLLPKNSVPFEGIYYNNKIFLCNPKENINSVNECAFSKKKFASFERSSFYLLFLI